MTDEINWDDDATVVVKEIRPVAVYRNSYGQIVVRQQAFDRDEDDPFITLPDAEMRKLVDAVQRQLDSN